MNVIVTGGLGFIGSHVVDGLLGAGHDVEIIDSMVGAVTDGTEYDSHPRCIVHRVSINDYFESGRDFSGADRVIHAASLVGPAGILQYQGRLGGEIVAAAQQVIDGCLEAGASLCTFSSAEVYGRSGLLSERDPIVVPAHYNARIEYADRQDAHRGDDDQQPRARPRVRRGPAVQRGRPAPVARRRVRAADVRAAGARRHPADRLRGRHAGPGLPGRQRAVALRRRSPRRRVRERRRDLQPRQPGQRRQRVDAGRARRGAPRRARRRSSTATPARSTARCTRRPSRSRSSRCSATRPPSAGSRGWASTS